MNAEVRCISSGHGRTCGPVWHRDGYLLFCDPAADRICIWTHEGVKTYRRPSARATALAFDSTMALCAAEQTPPGISKALPFSAPRSCLGGLASQMLEGPVALGCVHGGAIWYIDRKALYSAHGLKPPTLQQTLGDPTGLAVAWDQKTIYVADQRQGLLRYTTEDQGIAATTRLVPNLPNGAGGISTNDQTRIFVACAEGLQCYASDGSDMGLVETPEPATGCCWVPTGLISLFVTAGRSVYSIELETK